MKINKLPDTILEGVEKYFTKKYDDPHKNALYNYVMGLTSTINNSLRKENPRFNRPNKEIIQGLDDMFNTLGEEKIIDVYRTVDWGYLENVYGMTKENIDSFIGKSFTNKGYMSTAMEMTSPWGSRWSQDEVILHITSTKKVNCIEVEKYFSPDEIDCMDQKELLFPRNTQITLNSYTFQKRTFKFRKLSSEGNYILEFSIKEL